MKRKDYLDYKNLIKPYIDKPIVASMKEFIQHGKITTYEHCMKVTETCFKWNRKFRLKAREDVLVEAAILHDFYLYDWHEDSDDHRLHGFFHPKKAANNAKKYFNVKHKTAKAIESHMWPLTITKIPTSREAWILCLADKYCALKETLFERG